MVALLPLLHAVDATLSRTSARHGTPPCRVSLKGKAAEPPGRRAKVSTLAAHPAMGWTSPLPAVRMRAAMLVSAVVATCRGRLRRGAIREDGCWLTSCTDGVGFSYKLSQPDCLRFVPAPMLLRANNCDARFGFWLPTRRASVTISCSSYRSDAATARARTVTRACEFQTRGRSREEQ